MVKVVFVGDEPTDKNILPDLAFVGTRSLTTLTAWIKAVEPDYYVYVNSKEWKDLFDIHRLKLNGFKIVTLGNSASSRVRSFIHSDFFKLPHPSGRNRKLNDKSSLNKILEECRQYVRS